MWHSTSRWYEIVAKAARFLGAVKICAESRPTEERENLCSRGCRCHCVASGTQCVHSECVLRLGFCSRRCTYCQAVAYLHVLMSAVQTRKGFGSLNTGVDAP